MNQSSLLGHAKKSKVRKCPTSLGPFSPFIFVLFFSFCCSDGPSTCLATSSKSSENHQEGQVSPCKFYSVFFTHIPDHSLSYLRLHRADHSELGIIGKILFLQKLSIDDVNFGQRR